MSKYLLFSLLFICSLGAQAHKFYTSITDINYNQQNKSLEIMMKFFIDDFEESIKNIFDVNLNLDTKKELNNSDSIINIYLNQEFKLKIKNKTLNYSYLGKEADSDYIWLYIEVEKVKSTNNFSVQNTMLIKQFPKQTNLINFESENLKSSKVLNKDLTAVTF
jgi:hypothetical protein